MYGSTSQMTEKAAPVRKEKQPINCMDAVE